MKASPAFATAARRRIFVRLPNWLGDVLLARPLLYALRGSFPDAHLTAAAPALLLELLAGDRVWDAAVDWPRRGPARAAAARAMRAARPDVALVLPPSWSSAWQAWRSSARERIGYAAEGRRPLLTQALRRPMRGERHLAEEYLDLGRLIGARAHAVPPLIPPPAGVEAANQRLAGLGLAAAAFVVLAPGAAFGPAKRWPAERFVAVGRRRAEAGEAVLVCGAADEAGVAQEVADGIGPAAVSLAGRTSLPELAGLLARARLAACNDSGAAHLAAAVGTPTVAIFGSTSSAWTAPLGPAVRVVQRAPVCSPCFQHRCAIGTICLTGIDARRVDAAASALLAGT